VIYEKAYGSAVCVVAVKEESESEDETESEMRQRVDAFCLNELVSPLMAMRQVLTLTYMVPWRDASGVWSTVNRRDVKNLVQYIVY
jgi:hypothetical protein